MYLRGIGAPRLNLSLGHVAGAAVAASVVCFTLGSSSVALLKSFGGQARWLALVVLWVFAVLTLCRRRPGLPKSLVAGIVLLGGFLLGLAFLSASWSGDPRLTFDRAASFAIVVTGAASLAAVVAASPRVARDVATAVVATVAVLNGVGLLLLLPVRGDAAQSPSTSSPWRFRGLGENPNTVSMLAGITMPLAVWAVLESSTRRRRVVSGTAVLLSFMAITLSGSRGAVAAAAIGTVVTALAMSTGKRRAVGLAAAAVLAAFASLGLSQIPQPKTVATSAGSLRATTTAATTSSGAVTTTRAAVPSFVAAPGSPAQPSAHRIDFPQGLLADEVGRPSSARSLFGSSGRIQAWRGAIDQGNERASLGYGFGTERRVFIDHYQTFESQLVENSFIGLYLQLGIVGLLVFVVLLAAIAVAGIRARMSRVGSNGSLLAALFGVFAGGVVLMCVQSYVYSAGNVSTVPFWLCASLVVGLGSAGRGDVRATRWLGMSRRVGMAFAAAAVILALLVPLGRWQKDRAIARTGRAMKALVMIPGPQLRSHLSGSRISRGVDCLLYAVARDRTAIELCFSADGHLVEAIDRRRGDAVSPRFLSYLDEPSASPLHPPVRTLLARFHQAGQLLDVPLTATRLPISGTDYKPKLIPT
jgi:O-antigen ligase